MKPFIILGISRTGTTMFTNAISSHPDIPRVVHEFRGDEVQFWAHPFVLSNYLKDWMKPAPLWCRVLRNPFWPMRWRRIRVIHLYREDAVAGARSLLLMSYKFPDGVVTLPPDEVNDLAKWRQKQDKEFREAADYSVSYESLCNGKETTKLPEWFSDRFCNHIGLPVHELTTNIRKIDHLILRAA